MRDFGGGGTADYQVPADVDVGVVVHQLGAGIGARSARQARVQGDPVILVVPGVVNYVELVTGGEQPDRAGVVAQVTAVALVHLPLVSSCHATHDQEHDCPYA